MLIFIVRYLNFQLTLNFITLQFMNSIIIENISNYQRKEYIRFYKFLLRSYQF